MVIQSFFTFGVDGLGGRRIPHCCSTEGASPFHFMLEGAVYWPLGDRLGGCGRVPVEMKVSLIERVIAFYTVCSWLGQ